MKSRHVFFATVFLIAGAGLEAMPPVQHFMKGIVQSVDEGTQTFVVAPSSKNPPSTFVVKKGRTRLRQAGTPATLSQLKVGQWVRTYYKKELAEWVAIEVSWKAAAGSKPIEAHPLHNPAQLP